MGESNTKYVVGTIAIVCFVISFIAYCFVMGFGWGFNQSSPRQSMLLAGAIVSTIPVFAVIAFVCIAATCGEKSKATDIALCCMVCIIWLAAVFELVGAILFIVEGVQLKDQNPAALGFGVTAGVFGIIAAITCCCTSVTAFVHCCGSGNEPYIGD